MGTLKLELKSELNYPICMHTVNFINLLHYTPPFLLGLTIDWKIEDSDGS